MAQKNAGKEIRKYLRTISDNMRGLKNSPETESIHKMRVAVKKMRAIVRMAEVEDELKAKGIFKKMKKAYAAAGAIRDTEIYYEALNGYFNPGNIKTYYSGMAAGLHKKLVRSISVIDIDKFTHTALKVVPDKLGQMAIRKFIAREKKLIDSKLEEQMSDNTLHDIRKHFKNILYSLPYLKVNKRNSALLQRTKAVAKITTKLGDYVDTCMKLKHLNGELHGTHSRDYRAALEKARIDWLLLKHRQKDKLTKKLSEGHILD